MPVQITEGEMKAALPDVTRTLQLSGLERPVVVYRDRWGIPHIRAENEIDLFFAQGFVTAQDRLWHMDFDRRRALGRWAEVAGPDGLEQDRLLRAAGMGRTAVLDYEASGPEAKAMIDAYTAGVNAFLDTSTTLPIEYRILDRTPERWENWHCLTVYKMRNTLLGTFEPKLFRTRLARAIGPERVTVTHHGPVIAGDPALGLGVAISDPGLIEGSQWPDAARDAMRATSVDDLHEAFRHWTDRVNNYAVGDVHGNFGYLHEGRIPIRGESNGWRAVPGWTGEYEWEGYIPQDELPKAINPETGYAVTCNQRVAGHDYPYFVGLDFAPEFRARRIQIRILELERGRATVGDMAQIHAEGVSIPARVLTGALAGVAPLDEDSSRALSLMREWDGHMDRDRVQPTIYAKMKSRAVHRLLDHLLGDLAEEAVSGAAGSSTLVRQLVMHVSLAIERDDRSMLPDGTDWTGLLASALRDAVADLKATLGDDMAQWQWGRLHRTRPQHPLSVVFPELADLLDPPSVPMHGDGDTPLAGSYGLEDDFIVSGLSVNRYIHDPSDWTKSIWIVPLGSSGHPGSPHYADQAEMWSNVEFIPQLWDWNQIASEAEAQQRLEPEALSPPR